MSIFRKRPNLAQAEFEAYWRDVHAPIAVRIPALLRYEQNCVADGFHRGAPEARVSVDGVCKLLFADDSAMQGVMSPVMKQMLMEDEAKFLRDLATFVVRPVVAIPASGNAVTKCVIFVTRRAGLDPAAFEERWCGEHAAWMRQLPELRGYTQNMVTARTMEREPVTYERLPVDCIDEMWLEQPPEAAATRQSVEAMQRHAESLARSTSSFIVSVHVPALPPAPDAATLNH